MTFHHSHNNNNHHHRFFSYHHLVRLFSFVAFLGFTQLESIERYFILTALSALISYMAIVNNKRQERITAIQQKYPDPTLPLRDLEVAKEVARVTRQHDFVKLLPFAYDMVSIRAMALPPVSKTLASSRKRREGSPPSSPISPATPNRSNEGNKLDDMNGLDLYGRLLLSRMMTGGLVGFDEALGQDEPPLGQHQQQQQQQQHDPTFLYLKDISLFSCSNSRMRSDDYLYLIGLLSCETIRWLNRYGPRSLTVLEQNAHFSLWRHYGISKLQLSFIPTSLSTMESWVLKYENFRMVFCRSNMFTTFHRTQWMIQQQRDFFDGGKFLLSSYYRDGINGLLGSRFRMACALPERKRDEWAVEGLDGYLHLCRLVNKYLVLPN